MHDSNDIDTLLVRGSIRDIGRALRAHHFTVRDMIQWHLARIETFNWKGPTLNALRHVSKTALDEAAAADKDLAAGRDLGPLHGIAVAIKDNILIADEYTCSAGVSALADFRPTSTARIVKLLRAAGAIVIGKSNLTEFADYVSDVMPAEFSAAGGVVLNPHGIRYGRGQGSSVGSAACVAASFAPIAIGGETQNSIQTPANFSSVVGYKPSIGLISRTGIMPLVPSQDAPGTLTRSIEDAQIVMSVIGAADAGDAMTLLAPRTVRAEPLYERLSQVRIGVPRRAMSERPEFESVRGLFQETLERLQAGGCQIVDPCDLPSADPLQEVRSSVFRTEFKASLNGFLEDQGSPCGIDSLETLIRWNDRHPEKIPYGQSLLLAAQETRGVNSMEYRADRARDIALSLTGGIEAALRAGSVDVLIAPMGAAAKCTGKAGAPTLAIPAGMGSDGTPFGVTLYTAPYSDRTLIEIGRLVEREIGARHYPKLS